MNGNSVALVITCIMNESIMNVTRAHCVAILSNQDKKRATERKMWLLQAAADFLFKVCHII